MRKQLTERESKLQLIKAVMDGDIAKARELTSRDLPWKSVTTHEGKGIVYFGDKEYSFDEWVKFYPSIKYSYSFVHIDITVTKESANKTRWLDNPSLIIEIPDNGRDSNYTHFPENRDYGNEEI